jgi:energy-coupling factor transport system permease protein
VVNEAGGALVRKAHAGIDARVKLLQILLFGIMLFLLHTELGSGLQIAVLAGFLVFLRLPGCALKLTAYYGSFSLLYWLFTGVMHGGAFVATLTLIVFLLRKLSLIVGIYYLFTRAMTIGEFLNALNTLRLPQKLIIPLAVTLRFLPTIGQEVSVIGDALRLRGKPLTVLSFCRAPMEMLEYVFVPLMMRCVLIADELSASAVARGIENPHMHTAMFPLQFRRADAVYLTVLLASSVALVAYEMLL